MKTLTTKTEIRDALEPHGHQRTIGLVPTMGFLHDGHISLMRAARERCDIVVASIFVNPTQFGENEDLDTYPRDAEGDTRKCAEAGVDFLWMPETPSVYHSDHSTTVAVEGLTSGLCGRSRPGHFDGVTTIVSKLFNIVGPDRAFFGEKDYQQLAVIRRMVRDLDFPIEIVGVPIVRADDGIALSSRNSYLSSEERQAGLLLSTSLREAQQRWRSERISPAACVQQIRDTLARSPLTRVDYIEIVDPDSLEPLTEREGDFAAQPAVAAMAVHVGGTRLIDNARLDEKFAII